MFEAQQVPATTILLASLAFTGFVRNTSRATCFSNILRSFLTSHFPRFVIADREQSLLPNHGSSGANVRLCSADPIPNLVLFFKILVAREMVLGVAAAGVGFLALGLDCLERASEGHFGDKASRFANKIIHPKKSRQEETSSEGSSALESSQSERKVIR